MKKEIRPHDKRYIDFDFLFWKEALKVKNSILKKTIHPMQPVENKTAK